MRRKLSRLVTRRRAALGVAMVAVATGAGWATRAPAPDRSSALTAEGPEAAVGPNAVVASGPSTVDGKGSRSVGKIRTPRPGRGAAGDPAAPSTTAGSAQPRPAAPAAAGPGTTATPSQPVPGSTSATGGPSPQPAPSSQPSGAAPAQAGTQPPAPAPDPPHAPPTGSTGGVLVASSFERPVCGRWYTTLPPGCEFGVQGAVETGPFGARTGPGALRLDRTSPEHMGVVVDQPLPAGHGFIGTAHRVPAFPAGAVKSPPGHIQIMQLSPADEGLKANSVEVRIYADRRLGLALTGADDATMANWQVPVDQWFYVVVEVANGTSALQRMWVYDGSDRLVAEVSARLATQSPSSRGRTAQKVGGSTPTAQPMYTYADDWYVSNSFLGPARVSASGAILS